MDGSPSAHPGATKHHVRTWLAACALFVLVAVGTLVYEFRWIPTVVSNNADDARRTGTKAMVDVLDAAIQAYAKRHGQLPPSLDTLLASDPANGRKPYVETNTGLGDAWGHDLAIVEGTDPGTYEVVSYGKNGVSDGFSRELGFDADISSRRPIDR